MKRSVVVMAVIAITWTGSNATAAGNRKPSYQNSRNRSTTKKETRRRSLSEIFGLKKRTSQKSILPPKSTLPPASIQLVSGQKVAQPKRFVSPPKSKKKTTLVSKIKSIFEPQPATKKVVLPSPFKKSESTKTNSSVVLASGQQQKRPVVQQLNSMFQRDRRPVPNMNRLPNTQLKQGQVVRARKQPVQKKKGLIARLFGPKSKPQREPAKLPNLYSHKDPGPPRGSRTSRTMTAQKKSVALTPVPEPQQLPSASDAGEYVVIRKRGTTTAKTNNSQQAYATPPPAPPAIDSKWEIANPFAENVASTVPNLKVVPQTSVQPTSEQTASPYTGVTIGKSDAVQFKQVNQTRFYEAAPLPSDRTKLTKADKIRLVSMRKGLVGLKGFCPVALIDSQYLFDTRPEFESRFGLKTYYFSSAEARSKFEENPTRYIPAAGGMDVVQMKKSDSELDGSLDHSAWFKGRLYLFTSEMNQKMFQRNPESFAKNF